MRLRACRGEGRAVEMAEGAVEAVEKWGVGFGRTEGGTEG